MAEGIMITLNKLFGNYEGAQKVINAYAGKTIKDVGFPDENLDNRLRSHRYMEDRLILEFEDGTGLMIWDNGQSCCEARYMTTDDDLPYYVGSEFRGAEVRDAESREDEYGDVHELQFLLIHTGLGTFTIETHNEHNGYYGGFWLVVEEITAGKH